MMTQQTPTATRWLTRTLAPCLLALSACLLEPLGELPNLECSSLLDTDLDGVPDCQDNCPKLANPAQIDEDLDGVGDRCAVDGWLLFSQFERTTIADDDFGHGYSADRQALQLASPSPTGRYLAFASPDKRNVIVRSQPFVGATAETVATLSIREGISQINWSPDERHLIFDVDNPQDTCFNSMQIAPLDGSHPPAKVREVIAATGLHPDWLSQFRQPNIPRLPLEVTVVKGRASSPDGRSILVQYEDHRGENCVEWPILAVWNLATMSFDDCLERPSDCASADEKVKVGQAFAWPLDLFDRTERHLKYRAVGWRSPDHVVLQVESSYGDGFIDLTRDGSGGWSLSPIRSQLDPPVRIDRARLAQVIQPYGSAWRFEYTRGFLDRVAVTGSLRPARVRLFSRPEVNLREVWWSPGALDADHDQVPDHRDPCIGAAGASCADTDNDGDGQTPSQGDCNDALAGVRTEHDERCNDLTDSDCDGLRPAACVDRPLVPLGCPPEATTAVSNPAEPSNYHPFQYLGRRPCFGWFEPIQGARLLGMQVRLRLEIPQVANANEALEVVSYRVDRAGGQAELLFPHSTRVDHFDLSRRTRGRYDFEYTVDFTGDCDRRDDFPVLRPQHHLCVPQGVQLGANEVVLISPGISTNNSSNSGENFRLYSAGTWVQYTYQTAYETIQTQPQYLQPY